jgi:hypothetical protein
MLKEKNVLRSGLLTIPIDEHLFHNSLLNSKGGNNGEVAFDFQESPTLACNDNNSDGINSMAVSCTEIASGYNKSFHLIPDIPNKNIVAGVKWIVSSQYLLYCSSNATTSSSASILSEFRIFSLLLNSWIDLRGSHFLALKKISLTCQHKLFPGFFIFYSEEEDSFQTLLVPYSNSDNQFPVRLSPLLKMNRIMKDLKLKFIKGSKVISISCHPILPLLFACYSNGYVLVRCSSFGCLPFTLCRLLLVAMLFRFC